MEDKTAKIPSLKEFEESRRERDAHAQRTLGIQSKKQMKRSLEKQRPSASRTGVSDSTRQFSSQELVKISRKEKPSSYSRTSYDNDLGSTKVFDVPVTRTQEYRRPQKQKAAPARTNNQTRRQSAQRPPYRDDAHRNTQRQPASRYEHTRTSDDTKVYTGSQSRVNRTSESVTKSRKPAPTPRTYARDRINMERSETKVYTREHRSSTPSGNVRTDSVRRTSTARSRKPVPQPSKPKKILSPTARKIRKFFVSAAIVLAVLLIGAVLSLTVLFKTEVINVNGNGEYPVSEIIEVSGLVKGENIFTAAKNRAEDRIEKAYPFIEKADIYAVFPNAINIDITMAKPACMFEDGGNYYVVSEQGKVLGVSATTDEIDAPVIEGMNLSGKPAGEYIKYESDIISSAMTEIATAFRVYGCTDITAINVASDSDGTVEFKYVYDDRIVVYLGIPEHLDYKIQTAHAIITEKIDIGSANLAGELDVSMCYESKKSYFNQYTILAENKAPEPTSSVAVDENGQALYSDYSQQGDNQYSAGSGDVSVYG